MKLNKNSLKNLEKRVKFPKAPQGFDDVKSDGQIKLAKNTNLLCSARTMFENANILPDLVANLKEEVAEGKNENAIKFFNVIKEPDKQELKIDAKQIMPAVINILPVKGKDEL